jgi:polyisoprenyl-phosphate glycosyltransferase
MNFVSLVVHGLSAISVFSETVGVRLLLTAISLVFVAACGIISVVVVRLFTDLAMPGWATFAAGIFIIMLFQLVILAMNFSFIILNNRKDIGFLPIKEYSHFIRGLKTIWGKQ